MRHRAATLPTVIRINVKIMKELYGMEVSFSTVVIKSSFNSSFVKIK